VLLLLLLLLLLAASAFCTQSAHPQQLPYFLPSPTLNPAPCAWYMLAGETISEEYITEYSTDKIEMHTGAIEAGQRVLLVSFDEEVHSKQSTAKGGYSHTAGCC
jgi:hypothetical protein